MSSRKRDAPGVSSAMTADTRGSPDAAGTTAGATCGVQRIIVAQSLHLEGCGACLSMPSGQQGMSAIIADISVSVAACAYEGATTGAATRPAATSHASIRRRIQRPLMRVMVPQTVPVWKPLIVTKATAKSAVNRRGTSVPNPTSGARRMPGRRRAMEMKSSWYSWVGSNHRPPVPQTGALTS